TRRQAGFLLPQNSSIEKLPWCGLQRSEDQVIAASAEMKNPPAGGFFIAAKFLNREVAVVRLTRKQRSSNCRVRSNKKAR
ncbi:MAG: hypothetical protein ACO22Q_14810, partial [Burkholderiales bacterium]